MRFACTIDIPLRPIACYLCPFILYLRRNTLIQTTNNPTNKCVVCCARHYASLQIDNLLKHAVTIASLRKTCLVIISIIPTDRPVLGDSPQSKTSKFVAHSNSMSVFLECPQPFELINFHQRFSSLKTSCRHQLYIMSTQESIKPLDRAL